MITINNANSKIDVAIPVYNGENFILQALESVACQTLLPNKIIIIDDGSTDNTNKLISDYAKNSKLNIKIIKKENGGLSSARNTGIKESDAEFIAFLDADDLWLPDKLKKQIEIYNISEFKQLGLVYCAYSLITENGDRDADGYVVPLDKNIRGKIFKKLLRGNKILSSGSGALIKKEVFDSVGLFDENLKFGEDWDMWLRIAELYEVDYSDEMLVHIRRHSKSMTYEVSKVFLGEISFYNKWVSKIKGRYTIPSQWSDKLVFRILMRLPKNDFIKILKERMTTETRREIFRKTFGSISFYAIFFAFKQPFNLLFTPKLFLRFMKEIKNKVV